MVRSTNVENSEDDRASSNQHALVDLKSQVCTCHSGANGRVCVHLLATAKFANVTLFTFPPFSATDRQTLHWISSGVFGDISFYLQHGEEPIDTQNMKSSLGSEDDFNNMWHNVTNVATDEVSRMTDTAKTEMAQALQMLETVFKDARVWCENRVGGFTKGELNIVQNLKWSLSR